MGETRKVSAYPHLVSYILNIPMMKEAIQDERYKTCAKKSTSKRENRTLLNTVKILIDSWDGAIVVIVHFDAFVIATLA
jgi:hypothetical protein